jgi:hypothetical protein
VPARGSKDVFVNVPFDEAYEPLFIALIAGLTRMGLTPRSVLEILVVAGLEIAAQQPKGVRRRKRPR